MTIDACSLFSQATLLPAVWVKLCWWACILLVKMSFCHSLWMEQITTYMQLSRLLRPFCFICPVSCNALQVLSLLLAPCWPDWAAGVEAVPLLLAL